jgi:hypothetical protein
MNTSADVSTYDDHGIDVSMVDTTLYALGRRSHECPVPSQPSPEYDMREASSFFTTDRASFRFLPHTSKRVHPSHSSFKQSHKLILDYSSNIPKNVSTNCPRRNVKGRSLQTEGFCLEKLDQSRRRRHISSRGRPIPSLCRIRMVRGYVVW